MADRAKFNYKNTYTESNSPLSTKVMSTETLDKGMNILNMLSKVKMEMLMNDSKEKNYENINNATRMPPSKQNEMMKKINSGCIKNELKNKFSKFYLEICGVPVPCKKDHIRYY